MLLLLKFSSIVQIRRTAVRAEPAQRPLELAVEKDVQPFRHPDGVPFMSLRIHSSVMPTKAYL